MRHFFITGLLLLVLIGQGYAWEPSGTAPWLGEGTVGLLLDWQPQGHGLLQDAAGRVIPFHYDPRLIHWEGTPTGSGAFDQARRQEVYIQVYPGGAVHLYNPYRALIFRVEGKSLWARAVNGRGEWQPFSLEGDSGVQDGQIALVKVALRGDRGDIQN
ncbi:MAG: hypothetical protein ACOYD6_04895 [Limnochordia bacterium]